MKKLYLLRGAPGSGKSTWVKQNNLEKLCLSSDKLRLLFPQFGETITQIYDTQVRKLLYELLEKRMQVSQDVIIDATHYKKSYIKDYKPYAETYSYEIVIIQFDTDIVECKRRNALRINGKVSEKVIDKMYNTIKTNQKEVEKEYKILTPEQGLLEIKFNKGHEIVERFKHLEFFRKFNEICPAYAYRDSQELDELIDKLRPIVLEYFPILKILDVEHNNKWHYRTILDHSIEVLCRFKREVYNYNLVMNSSDAVICLFHDIGKIFAMTSNKTDEYAHYYGHGLIGYQFFNEYCRPRLDYDETIADYIANIIKIHDDEIKENITDTTLLLLNLADAKSHKFADEDKIKSRIDKAKELLSFSLG